MGMNIFLPSALRTVSIWSFPHPTSLSLSLSAVQLLRKRHSLINNLPFLRLPVLTSLLKFINYIPEAGSIIFMNC